MSNLLDATTADETCTAHPCRAIEMLLEPHVKDLGGFSVRRLLPSSQRRMVGPFIFFDHFGPAAFAPGEGMDVRPHPHINLATVTYLFEGEILHRDSLGSVQAIRPGAINLMTAGAGIVHSERTPQQLRSAGHRLHGLQLWLALPEVNEEDTPAFVHYPAEVMPTRDEDGVRLRVMIGTACGLTSPVKTCSEALYLEAELQPGAVLQLPDEVPERAVYVVSGQLNLGRREMPAHSMAVLDASPRIQVTARQPTRLAMIGGAPLGKRYIDWNFVSSRQERIAQAKDDWRNDRFAKVPGETEFIPLP